jgi:hypothetical protein
MFSKLKRFGPCSSPKSEQRLKTTHKANGFAVKLTKRAGFPSCGHGELPGPPKIVETSIAEPQDPEALALVERYAACELSLSDLRQPLGQILGSRFRQNEKLRWISLSSVGTEPSVRITRWHLENALSKRRCKLVSDQDLIDWASTVISNSIYFWDGKDRDLISEWINHLTLDFSPGDPLPSTSP